MLFGGYWVKEGCTCEGDLPLQTSGGDKNSSLRAEVKDTSEMTENAAMFICCWFFWHCLQDMFFFGGDEGMETGW